MNCLMCRLTLIDLLADAVFSMEETAFGFNENEFNPQEIVVDGDAFRLVDAALAQLITFEESEL